MSEFFFNIDHGYLEGLIRGFKSGLLTTTDYANLVQCETLEDLKLHIQSTDYGNFLANEPGSITVQVIDERLKEKLVAEFNHLRNNALEPLSTFLDFITFVFLFFGVCCLYGFNESYSNVKCTICISSCIHFSFIINRPVARIFFGGGGHGGKIFSAPNFWRRRRQKFLFSGPQAKILKILEAVGQKNSLFRRHRRQKFHFQRRRRKFFEFWTSRCQISSFFSAAGENFENFRGRRPKKFTFFAPALPQIFSFFPFRGGGGNSPPHPPPGYGPDYQ
ncbi:unnamed protein product [Meloidogyne enterolobii]|uniref:Uncharacterized protein n=1 Tax=Meloidogyne enterolobii TaxID=390850 RepID=A0ACB0Y7H2_MELEN